MASEFPWVASNPQELEHVVCHSIVPVSRLMERARPVGTQVSKAHPVFYTEDALARAEMFSRRGGHSQPPEETGGVLTGTLGSCPESGEFFSNTAIPAAPVASVTCTTTGRARPSGSAPTPTRSASRGSERTRSRDELARESIEDAGGRGTADR